MAARQGWAGRKEGPAASGTLPVADHPDCLVTESGVPVAMIAFSWQGPCPRPRPRTSLTGFLETPTVATPVPSSVGHLLSASGLEQSSPLSFVHPHPSPPGELVAFSISVTVKVSYTIRIA